MSNGMIDDKRAAFESWRDTQCGNITLDNYEAWSAGWEAYEQAKRATDPLDPTHENDLRLRAKIIWNRIGGNVAQATPEEMAILKAYDANIGERVEAAMPAQVEVDEKEFTQFLTWWFMNPEMFKKSLRNAGYSIVKTTKAPEEKE